MGVLLSRLFSAAKIAQLFRVTSTLGPDGRERTYVVEGQLFLTRAEEFLRAFDFCEPRRVCRRLQLLSRVEPHEQDHE